MSSSAVVNADKAREAAGMIATGNKTEIQVRREQREADTMKMIPRMVQLAGDEALAKRITWDAITALASLPALIDCTFPTFVRSLFVAAQLRLRPNLSALGHGWILPYKNNDLNVTEAQWIPGYKGMVVVAARSGVQVHAETIFVGDEYVYERGLHPVLIHKPKIDQVSTERTPVAHYCTLHSAHSADFTLMPDPDVRKRMERSQSYKFGGRSSPWRTDYLPMARKTAVRDAFRWSPTESPELVLALVTDQSEVDLNLSDPETAHLLEPIGDALAGVPDMAPASTYMPRPDVEQTPTKPQAQRVKGRKHAAPGPQPSPPAPTVEDAVVVEDTPEDSPDAATAPPPAESGDRSGVAIGREFTPEELAEHERRVQEESA